jgi:hypothetical protein
MEVFDLTQSGIKPSLWRGEIPLNLPLLKEDFQGIPLGKGDVGGFSDPPIFKIN